MIHWPAHFFDTGKISEIKIPRKLCHPSKFRRASKVCVNFGLIPSNFPSVRLPHRASTRTRLYEKKRRTAAPYNAKLSDRSRNLLYRTDGGGRTRTDGRRAGAGRYGTLRTRPNGLHMASEVFFSVIIEISDLDYLCDQVSSYIY